MDWCLAILALFNTASMVTVYMPRAIPNAITPWFVFGFSLIATELAWIWLPFQLLVTLVLTSRGALDSTLGATAMWVLALSWLGLGRSIQLGLRSGDVVENALQLALGRGYREEIPESVRAHFREMVVSDDWRHPFRMQRPDVERIRNIAYARGGVRHVLDIYRPSVVPPEGCPVVMWIHGGAWVMGSKNEQGLPMMNHLASKGWICVAPNYRLSPSVSFPTQLFDCKTALCWIRSHGREFGMNPDFVAVTGGSAGGHLAALMGLTENRPAEFQPDAPDADTSVQACLPFYGVFDFRNRYGQNPAAKVFAGFLERWVMHVSPDDDPMLWDQASPIALIHERAPPFMIIHGNRDSLAPIGEARLFSQRLRARSRSPVAFLELPGAEHAFELMHSPRTEHTIDGVHRFLEWVRANPPGA